MISLCSTGVREWSIGDLTHDPSVYVYSMRHEARVTSEFSRDRDQMRDHVEEWRDFQSRAAHHTQPEIVLGRSTLRYFSVHMLFRLQLSLCSHQCTSCQVISRIVRRFACIAHSLTFRTCDRILHEFQSCAPQSLGCILNHVGISQDVYIYCTDIQTGEVSDTRTHARLKIFSFDEFLGKHKHARDENRKERPSPR